ncbi:ABC transporter permease [Microtetraspora malaysiensis]|uniref:ABC transporter permease n=1 Tax=Microtetraspora malaysiensis TaxID=161358 RepID=UPI003D9023B4
MTSLTSHRPRPRSGALIQGLTLAWRSLVPLRNEPGRLVQLLLQPIFMIMLFVCLFGVMTGNQTGTAQFLLPGVLVQVALVATNTTGMNLAEDIGNGVFDRFRSLPIARSAPLIGRILADTLTMLLTVTASLLTGFVVGFRVRTSLAETLAGVTLVLLFTFALSWASAWIGLKARSIASMQGMATAVLLPLTFGSTAFIPAANVPGWLRWWMDVNPVSHLAASLRALLTGGPLGAHPWITLAWAIAIAAVFFPLAVHSYTRRIR